jgi:hypothetical protein
MNTATKIQVLQAAVNRPAGDCTWGQLVLIASDVASALGLKIGFNGSDTKPNTLDVHALPRGGRDFGRKVGIVTLPASRAA